MIKGLRFRGVTCIIVSFDYVFVSYCILVFTILIGVFGYKYRHRISDPTPSFTCLLAITWAILLLWAAIIFLSSTGLLAVGGMMGGICQTTEELLTQGGYENYPWLIDAVSPGLKMSNAETIRTLNSLATWSGDGDTSNLINTTSVKDGINKAVKEMLQELKRRQSEIRKRVAEANLEETGEQLLSAAFVIMPNFTSIETSDRTVLTAYQEVLLSGLQLKAQPLDKKAQNKINRAVGYKRSVANVLFGFEDAENKINSELQKVQPEKKLCFGRITACSTTLFRTGPKIVDETLVIDNDTELNEWAASFRDESKSASFLSSIKMMVWKLIILNANPSPFVMIDANNVETLVTYPEFVSPDKGSTAHVNTLVHELTVEFGNKLSDQIDTITVSLDELASKVINKIPEFRNFHRSLLAELLITKDALCRGIIKSIHIGGLMWFFLACFEVRQKVIAMHFSNCRTIVQPLVY